MKYIIRVGQNVYVGRPFGAAFIPAGREEAREFDTKDDAMSAAEAHPWADIEPIAGLDGEVVKEPAPKKKGKKS